MSSRILARLVKLAPLLLQFPTDAAKLFGFKPTVGWAEIVIPEPVVTPKWTAVNTVADVATVLSLPLVDTYSRFTAAAASTISVPANATVAFPIGAEIHIRRVGAANLTISGAAGVTVNAPALGTLVMSTRMSACLKKVGTNEWDLIGQTVAA